VTVGQDITDRPFQGNVVVSTRLYDFLSGIQTPDETDVQFVRGLQLARRKYHKAEEAVVVSDFPSLGWEEELRRLSWRRHLTVVHTLDPWDLALPEDIGEATVVDPRTGAWLTVNLSGRRGRKIRARYEKLAGIRQERVEAAVKKIRAAQYIDLRTDRDWIADLLTALGARR